VLEGLKRSHSVDWVPIQAFVNEVKEVRIVTSEDIFHLLSQGLALFALGVRDDNWLILLIKE
jgi:hypothetical protein